VGLLVLLEKSCVSVGIKLVCSILLPGIIIIKVCPSNIRAVNDGRNTLKMLFGKRCIPGTNYSAIIDKKKKKHVLIKYFGDFYF